MSSSRHSVDVKEQQAGSLCCDHRPICVEVGGRPQAIDDNTLTICRPMPGEILEDRCCLILIVSVPF